MLQASKRLDMTLFLSLVLCKTDGDRRSPVQKEARRASGAKSLFKSKDSVEVDVFPSFSSAFSKTKTRYDASEKC